MTDLHYADKKPAGSRHYRESLDKIAEAATSLADKRIEAVVELGDLIDAADSVDLELSYLKRIDAEFQQLSPKRHYVLGNHCVDTLTKQEFLDCVEQAKSFYSFDLGSTHFIVLDACFRSDGVSYGRRNFEWTDPNVSQPQLEWLAEDLKETSNTTVVFVHQRLDVSNAHGVKNAEAVREVLENSGNVAAVFQGHSHQNDYRQINGIHYCTLAAMVEGSGEENNSYSCLSVYPSGALELTGFRKQQSRKWKAGQLGDN